MSTIITASGLSQPDRTKGYIAHAIDAATTCLHQAGCALDEVDILINTGIYRDDNTCEPSVAALIQHGLGMHLNPMTTPARTHTFSFDLMNGACGLLNGLQVAHAILTARDLNRALLIAGESHPSMQPHPKFPFEHAGVALLVERSTSSGFSTFLFQSTPQFEGRSGYLDLELHHTASRHSLAFEHTESTTPPVQLIQSVVTAYIEAHDLDITNTELLFADANTQLATAVSLELGIPLSKGSIALQELGNLHSANLGFGLDNALASSTTDLLCVVIGTGMTIGCALYRQSA